MSPTNPIVPPNRLRTDSGVFARRARHIVGIGVSPGVVEGRVHLVYRGAPRVNKRVIAPEAIEQEIARLGRAIDEATEQILRARELLGEGTSTAHALLDAHAMMLRDALLVGGARQRIRGQLVNAEYAVAATVREIQAHFDALQDSYFRERRSDVELVGDNLIHNLLGHPDDALRRIGRGDVVVAPALSPADGVVAARAGAAAFVTDKGGATAHIALVARSFGLPAVVGAHDLADQVAHGDPIIVDGEAGTIVIWPDDQDLRAARERKATVESGFERAFVERDLPSVTTDDTEINLRANLDLPEESDLAAGMGAAGVGLFRSEYLFVGRSQLPDEDEQYQVYARVTERFAPHPVTVRTLDLGDDKAEGLSEMPPELARTKTHRAIRFCLSEPRLFRTQLRALIRASARGSLRILLPFVSRLDEIRQTRQLLGQAVDELRARGIDVPAPPLGAMIELPSAVLMADEIAREVDFLSVGTNDLIQYLLAVPRDSDATAGYYDPLHPAVLRALAMVAGAARRACRPLGICGELASDRRATPLLVGMGYTELSMAPRALPVIRRTVRSLSASLARGLAGEALLAPDANAVEELILARGGKSMTEPAW